MCEQKKTQYNPTTIFDRTTPLELTNSKHKPIAVSEAAKVIKNKGKINTSLTVMIGRKLRTNALSDFLWPAQAFHLISVLLFQSK